MTEKLSITKVKNYMIVYMDEQLLNQMKIIQNHVYNSLVLRIVEDMVV